MLIDLTDPNDTTVRGALYNPDPIDVDAVLGGAPITLMIGDAASSDDLDVLFDLSPPPSFFGGYQLVGELDGDALELYLSPDPDGRDHHFVRLEDFRGALDGSSGAVDGIGSLTRSNRLPSDVSWQLSP